MADYYKRLEPVTITPKRIVKLSRPVSPATPTPSLGIPMPKVRLNITVPDSPEQAPIDFRGPATAVIGAGNDVYSFYDDGSMDRRSGGHLNWRNNNPGNLEAGDFSTRKGAIGSNGRFAIFPDLRSGWNAQRDLLRGPDYSRKTILEAMEKYAPKKDGNNPVAYANFIGKALNLPVTARMNTLTDEQFDLLLDSIHQKEGNRPGDTRTIQRRR